MKIVIDADACPRAVLQTCFSLGKKYALPVWTVASFEHCIDSENHLIVGNDPQASDIKLMNITEAGDIAVTQDWGLAAMLLGKRVRCLNPAGRLYDKGKIDFMLEERNLKFRHRRGGGRTRGPRKRSREQDHKFAAILERAIQEQLAIDIDS
ncbi:MAG: DUF188 domain-containing protein [Firmicutes bacterium]|nr:DUF188 domain-containing protein [Bacillota bacterium]